MSTAVFTTDFSPRHALAERTIPRIQRYAEKIGATFIPIKTRLFPRWGDLYEKFQIHTLGAAFDFCIWIDWDVILKDGMINMAAQCPVDHVGHWGPYGASAWFELDQPFKDDTGSFEEPGPKDTVCPTCGQLYASKPVVIVNRPRDLAFADQILCVPRACHGVWEPCELPYETAAMYARRPKWLSEWNLARNCARLHYPTFTFKSRNRLAGGQDDCDAFMRINCLRESRTEQQCIDMYDEYMARR